VAEINICVTLNSLPLNQVVQALLDLYLLLPVLSYTSGPLSATPYHTSALSGQGWVLELINGHPERMHTELGVRVHVFRRMVIALQKAGMGPSKHISLEEKLAIFLYASVTGLSIRHANIYFSHKIIVTVYIIWLDNPDYNPRLSQPNRA
jgi:hypothetical protein